MHIQRKMGAVLGAAALVLSAACGQDLNVTNPNNPDVKRALANPGDVQSLAVSAAHDWYVGSTAVDPWVMLNVTGDLMTMNYGNFGARFNNLEPRIPYANDAANNDIEVTQVPWENQYQSLGEANDVLRAVGKGLQLPGGTDKYKALALWAQAGSLMQLALVFDKAFALDESYDPTAPGPKPTLKPYSEVEALAQQKLDALIALTNGQKWTYAKSEFPVDGGLDAAVLNQLANTMAAQLLAYTPRTAADAGKVDWTKVLQYANGGLTQDFVVDGDDNNWWSEFMGYFDLPSWMGVDQKLIHKMSPNVPEEYDGTLVPPQDPHDARLQIDTSADLHTSGADFIYKGKVVGDPGRGIYMQSPYRHERYIDVSWQADVPFFGPMPYTLAAENDLLKAEALIRTGGDRQAAADLINKTHVGRGKLTPIAATDNDSTFMAAITYEREVELNATNGFGFFALRHVDELRDGTVRHLPVPATELEVLQLPIYTFGGAGKPVLDVFAGGGSYVANNLGMTKTLELPNGETMPLLVPRARTRVTRAGFHAR